jgi:hypothetical protein
LSLAPAPPDSDMEAVRVEVLDEPATSVRDGAAKRRFSPEEEAELAKGLLRVVLG